MHSSVLAYFDNASVNRLFTVVTHDRSNIRYASVHCLKYVKTSCIMVIGYDRKKFTALSIEDKVIKNIVVIYMQSKKSCC